MTETSCDDQPTGEVNLLEKVYEMVCELSNRMTSVEREVYLIRRHQQRTNTRVTEVENDLLDVTPLPSSAGGR